MRRILRKILNKLNALHYKQEYLCLSLEDFQESLYVYHCVDNKIAKDVSKEHLFIGYRPVIIALKNDGLGTNHSLVFSEKKIPLNTGIGTDAVAFLSLKRIAQLNNLVIFEGVHAEHSFVGSFSQFIQSFDNRLFNNKPGNVFLKDNLFKQVQVAYAVPRKICLASIADKGAYNLFPTDLHGSLDNHYIISLRYDGKACKQVEQSKKILLSDIDIRYYQEIYALGKNHMKEMRPYNEFPFSGASAVFGLPIPKYAIGYKELELISTETHGIHKLLLFKIIHTERLDNTAKTLSHIHNLYATWRHKKNIDTKYYLR